MTASPELIAAIEGRARELPGVEFVDGLGTPARAADEVASLVYALSADHDACALPTVLIEADACARLAEEELTIIKDNIPDRLDPSASLELRRHRRPF